MLVKFSLWRILGSPKGCPSQSHPGCRKAERREVERCRTFPGTHLNPQALQLAPSSLPDKTKRKRRKGEKSEDVFGYKTPELLSPAYNIRMIEFQHLLSPIPKLEKLWKIKLLLISHLMQNLTYQEVKLSVVFILISRHIHIFQSRNISWYDLKMQLHGFMYRITFTKAVKQWILKRISPMALR